MNMISENSAKEAKALVAIVFRNGPIEDLHAGKLCPTCAGQPGYSRTTDAEMREVLKNAVNQLYRLLRLKIEDPRLYEAEVRRGAAHTATWDEPAGSEGDPAGTVSELGSTLPGGGVLVTMPLASWTAVPKDDDPYAAQHRRNRLETLLSFIAFTIKNQGIASAFELKVHGDRLNLLLAGSDAKGIEAELQRYFELLRLPERGKMVVFTAGSDMPEEVELDK